MLGLALIIEILQIAVFTQALRVMWPVSVLACRGLFGISFLMVARMAHELCTMPLLRVLAAKDIQGLYLLLVQVKPSANLVKVVVLDLAHTVFLMLLVELLLGQFYDRRSRCFLLRDSIAFDLVRRRFEEMEGTFPKEKAFEVGPVGLNTLFFLGRAY